MTNDFWSRRKAAVEAEKRAEEARRQAETAQAEEAKLDEKTDEEILAELDAPPPEEMESSEQVTAFLKEQIPQRLRTRALRRLWGLNPVLANLDGLIEYGEDYTDAATVVENMTTAYEVGKGMLGRFAESLEEGQDEAPETPKDESEIVENLPDQSYEVAVAKEENEIEDPASPENIETFAHSDDMPQNPSRSRRMQFQFRDG
jgi:hypothetical protein